MSNTATITLESTSPGPQSVALGGTVVAVVIQFTDNARDNIKLSHLAVTARCLATPPAAFPFVCRAGDPAIVDPIAVAQTAPDTWMLNADLSGYSNPFSATSAVAIVAEAQLGATDAIGSQWAFGVEAVADAHFVDVKKSSTVITTVIGTPAPVGAVVTIA